MKKYVIIGLILAVVAALILLAACGTEDPVPAQPTGIEIDVDRSKPKVSKPKPAKPAPALKTQPRRK